MSVGGIENGYPFGSSRQVTLQTCVAMMVELAGTVESYVPWRSFGELSVGCCPALSALEIPWLG